MARLARLVIPQMPHHVIQRGNRRQDVFFSDLDRWVYVRLLRAACRRYAVKIWAWCLMNNHVHFIAVPAEENGLARCFADAHTRYTRWLNARERWQGYLWQGRFRSSVMDERYLLAAVRYVERNPVRAGMVQQAWQYRWSSAAWHVGEVVRDRLVAGDEPLRALVGDWREYLRCEENEQEITLLERETLVNRPLGSEAFVRELGAMVGRPLLRGKPGRPYRAMGAIN